MGVDIFAQPYVHDKCSQIDPPVNKLNFSFSGGVLSPLSPNTKLRGILPAAAFFSEIVLRDEHLNFVLVEMGATKRPTKKGKLSLLTG